MADSSAPRSEIRRSVPLGASWDGHGTTFALLSSPATAAWLCLYDDAGLREVARLPMERSDVGPEGPRDVWTRHVPAVGPGQTYGFRVEGPDDPSRALLCHAGQLLFDPYARDYHPGTGESPIPKARVVDDAFDWAEDRPPRRPWPETVLYELHVKGMTALHPQVPEHLRGTYSGLVQPPILEHLLSLGVTAVELLPIFFSLSEKRLLHLGLSNYWGYNTLGFFAPDRRFAATDNPVREVKTMVKAFHEAGLEVILDVAYNHTAEGGRDGQTLSLKGLDNRGYYRLRDGEPPAYENFSGCGNTVDIRRPPARHLILQSLRYWAEEMRIDGFRFDLATSLGRTGTGFSSEAPFFQELRRDPVLKDCKLVAEPWDLGPGGYRLGAFPAPWREWNDRYRDALRSFWRGDPGRARDVAKRLTGSTDLFPPGGSRSINFITCHDGFTLRDLVSYETKHNAANGEANRDGHGNNLSSNGGVEGPTDDPALRRQRAALQRAMIATLALSLGVPMVGHGDELSRTQHGNNNAYCQDGPLSWVHWHADGDEDHRHFWSQAFRLRHSLGSFSEERGDASRWLHPSGRELVPQDWHTPDLRAFGWWLHRRLVLFNANRDAVPFHLPESFPDEWTVALESTAPTVPGQSPGEPLPEASRVVTVPGRALTVLVAVLAASSG